MNNTYPLQTRLNTGAIKDVSGTTTNCCLPVEKFTVSVGYANSLGQTYLNKQNQYTII